VTEAELRRRLAQPAPSENEATDRAWELVRAAFVGRERVPRIERRSPLLIAVAIATAVAVAAITPPGRAFVQRVRDAVGHSPSEPALVRLPAPGRLLVDSAQGPWVVQRDGSKRLLGSYDAASWSPGGKFVVATRGHSVVAIEPGGDVHWTVTRPRPVAQARWAPSGFRIAYREGSSLRVVAGDGTGDRLLASSVAAVAPAWRPGPVNTLAYASTDGSVHVVNVDTRDELWAISPGPHLRGLVWSANGDRLLSVSLDHRQRVYDAGGALVSTIQLAKGHVAASAAFAPAGRTVALTDFDLAANRSALLIVDRGKQRTVFKAAGRLADVEWSPSGRWLLVAWPSAGQWLFLRTPGVGRIITISNVVNEFSPGETATRSFPRLAGWCCS
jgi:WD40 repeat protein